MYTFFSCTHENHVQLYLNNRKLLSNCIDFNMHNIQFSQATMATVTIMHIVVCNSKSDITLDKPIPLCYFVVSRINSTSEIAFKWQNQTSVNFFLFVLLFVVQFASVFFPKCRFVCFSAIGCCLYVMYNLPINISDVMIQIVLSKR